MAAAMLNLTWYPEGKWYIPTNDLVEIYAMLNASGNGPLVEPQWINECAVIFYAGSWGVSLFGDLLYPVLAPYLGSLLLENYLDFHLGGIDDDAAWTGFMQNRFADWVSNGPPDEPPNRWMDKLASASDRRTQRSLMRRLVASLRTIIGSDNAFIQQTESLSKNGLFLSLSENVHEDTVEKIANAVIDSYVIPLMKQLGGADAEVDSSDAIHIARENVRQRIKDIHSGTDSYKVDGEKRNPVQNNVKSVNEIYHGDKAHEYLGHSFTVADLSNSGKSCDILVGSYGAGRSGGPQEGIARILFGAACGEESGLGDTVFGTVILSGATDLSSYERFGWSTEAVDLNIDGFIDAIVCSPSFGGKNVSAVVGNYSGRCDVFYGPFSATPESSGVAPNVQIYGDKIWGTFGDTMTSGDLDGDGHADLVISAPGAGSYPNIAPNSHEDLSNQGAIYVFLSSTWDSKYRAFVRGQKISVIACDEADNVMQPSGSYGWFGKSLLVIPSSGSIPALLAVGAPTYHPQDDDLPGNNLNSAVGRVFLYSAGSSDIVKNLNADLYTKSITGCGHAGRAGQSIAYSDSLGAIAISEPSFNVTTTEGLKSTEMLEKGVLGMHGLRSGRVLVTLIRNIVEVKETDLSFCELADDKFSSVILEGRDMEGRFGLSMNFLANIGNYGEDTIVIGAPIARGGMGSVHGYNLKYVDQDGALSFQNAFVVWGNFDGENKSRFGKTMAPIPAANSSCLSFIVGAPLADLGFIAPDNDERGRILRVDVSLAPL